jgi:hypothetical protein
MFGGSRAMCDSRPVVTSVCGFEVVVRMHVVLYPFAGWHLLEALETAHGTKGWRAVERITVLQRSPTEDKIQPLPPPQRQARTKLTKLHIAHFAQSFGCFGEGADSSRQGEQANEMAEIRCCGLRPSNKPQGGHPPGQRARSPWARR